MMPGLRTVRPPVCAVIVSCLTLVLGACSSNDDLPTANASANASTTTTTTTAPRQLPGHTTWTETFVDATRETKSANGDVIPSRTLETTIYRPNGTGPFPLIVFAHGSSGHPNKFTKLFAKW